MKTVSQASFVVQTCIKNRCSRTDETKSAKFSVNTCDLSDVSLNE